MERRTCSLKRNPLADFVVSYHSGMMKKIVMLYAFMIGTTPPAAATTSCPGVESGRSSPTDVESYYAKRAASIVKAAVASDGTVLNELVAADANFEIWQGDNAVGRKIGVAGAIEMVSFIKPVSSQSAIPISGPVWIAASPEFGPQCAWNATLLLKTDQADRAFEIRFDFIDERLSKACGHQTVLIESLVR